MSHNFLFDTYDFLDQQLEDIKQELSNNTADNRSRQYASGRMDALCEVESFLDMFIKPKLPKRLQRNVSRKICTMNQ